ncbi:SDR family NAD(P)-dependent oxidoreductase [Jannaschia sp. LMIT008]|uniref:SDR family NAD(P)-dependent oxidoreductase n=1 Tax=Jannaschia maritima TaxID=3032585 RepID=UPI0028113913|nr:SDR family NAD(P)-dependent oxidoreductase [Jannaschia sp. LMIT008]
MPDDATSAQGARMDRSADAWDFAGRTVAVTGATGGIAGAIVDAVAARGVTIVMHGRRVDALDRVVDRAADRGADIHRVTGDLADEPGDVAAVIADAAPIDVLFNVAGIYTPGDLLSVDVETICRDFDVNAVAAVAVMQAVLPGMNDRRRGRIVNVSSGGGSFAEGLARGHAAYAISKAALNAATVLGAGCARGDVKVNAMCPGWVRTAMGGPSASRSPEEGADTALWLAALPADGPTGGFFRDRRCIPW